MRQSAPAWSLSPKSDSSIQLQPRSQSLAVPHTGKSIWSESGIHSANTLFVRNSIWDESQIQLSGSAITGNSNWNQTKMPSISDKIYNKSVWDCPSSTQFTGQSSWINNQSSLSSIKLKSDQTSVSRYANLYSLSLETYYLLILFCKIEYD